MSAAAIRSMPLQAVSRPAQRMWRALGCLAMADLTAAALAVSATLLPLQDAHTGILHSGAYAASACSVIVAFAALGLYPIVSISPAQEFRRILLGSGIAYCIIACTRILEGGDGAALLIRVALAWALTCSSVILSRALVRRMCARRPWWGTSTVIFGSGENAKAIFRLLKHNANIGLKVAAVFDETPAGWAETGAGNAQGVHVGTTHEGLAFAEFAGIDHAIVALPAGRRNDVQTLLRYHGHNFKHLLIVPDLSSIGSLWAEPRDLGGVLALHVSQELRQPLPQLLKRAIDVLVAGTSALFALPLFAALILAVRLSSPGPIFYSQPRVGLANRPVNVWKFRTMYADGDQILARHLAKNAESRAEWERDRKLKNDPRVTWIGRLMRKTSVDELPQLWCVLTGDMSLVGPRPIVTAEIPRYGEHFQAYAAVRPGITGMWQISGRNNTSYDERVAFDEYYVRNWSVWLDLYIISRTIKTVLAADGAY